VKKLQTIFRSPNERCGFNCSCFFQSSWKKSSYWVCWHSFLL